MANRRNGEVIMGKRIIICLLCVMMLVSIGCKEEKDKQETVSYETVTFNTVLSEAAQRFQDDIDVNFNDEFTKTLLDKRFEQKGHSGGGTGGGKKDNYYYGHMVLYTGQLIDDKNVKSIKYTLSNCIGSFIDSSIVAPGMITNEKRNIVESISEPYVIQGNDQSEVAFIVYYCYDMNLGIREETPQIQKCMKYLRITAEVTYNDKSVKTYLYGIGFKYDSTTSVNTIQIYQLS